LSDTLCARRFPCDDAIGQLEALIADISSLPNVDSSLAHRARVVLDASPGRHLTIGDMSARLGTNMGYLSRAFQREFGVSLAQYQRRRRAYVTIGALPAGASIKETAFQNHCAEATVRRLVRAATGRTPVT
jgi:AraC-like DNA-binding protein